MRESDIIHENGNYWVGKVRDGYTVFRNDSTHATGCGVLYANNADGRSIAIASCDYKAKRDAGAERERRQSTATIGPIYCDPQTAFERAIACLVLSEKPTAHLYAGNFMYMHSDKSLHWFKHSKTRKYTSCPR